MTRPLQRRSRCYAPKWGSSTKRGGKRNECTLSRGLWYVTTAFSASTNVRWSTTISFVTCFHARYEIYARTCLPLHVGSMKTIGEPDTNHLESLGSRQTQEHANMKILKTFQKTNMFRFFRWLDVRVECNREDTKMSRKTRPRAVRSALVNRRVALT